MVCGFFPYTRILLCEYKLQLCLATSFSLTFIELQQILASCGNNILQLKIVWHFVGEHV